MASVGELFISLGFDVDAKKLKEFQSNLQDTHETMLKLGTATAGTVGILTGFVDHYAGAALKLTNIATVMDLNTASLQRFSNAMTLYNRNVSTDAGIDAYTKFASEITTGFHFGADSGIANAFMALGGNPGERDTDKALQQLREHYGESVSKLGRNNANNYLNQLGFSDDMIQYFSNPDAKKDAEADKYIPKEETLKHLKDAGDQLAVFDLSMTNFAKSMYGDVAVPLSAAAKILVSALDVMTNFNQEHPGAGAVEAGVLGFGSWYGGMALWKKLFGKSAKSIVSKSGSALESFAAEWNGAAGVETGGAVGMGLLGSMLIGSAFGSAALSPGGISDIITGKRESYMGQGSQSFANWAMGLDGKSKNSLGAKKASYITGFSDEMQESDYDDRIKQSLRIFYNEGRPQEWEAMEKGSKGNPNTINLIQNIQSNATDNGVVADKSVAGVQRMLNATAPQVFNGGH